MEEEGKEAKRGWKVRRRGKEMGTYEEERGGKEKRGSKTGEKGREERR